MNKLTDIILKLGTFAVLIGAATTKQQFSFYSFVGWTGFATSLYFAYKSFDHKQIGLVIYFSIIPMLVNPFKTFWFQKKTWHLIDWTVATMYFVIIYFDWTDNPKRKEL